MITITPLIQLKITTAVCAFVAVCTTCWRLYLRRQRFWWDDACSFLSMIFLLLQIAAIFLHVPNPAIFSKTTNVAAYYLISCTFYAIIWNARLSILFSVIRIDPNPNAKWILQRVAGLFILVLVILLAQLFWVCEPIAKTWKNKLSPQCPLSTQVVVCQLVTDVCSDLLLIIAPLRLLRGMNARDGTRRRLMIIFSTSIVTTIVSLVHATLIIVDEGIPVLIAAVVENTLSLIVCNMPVMSAVIFRILGSGDDSDKGTSGGTMPWKAATRRTGLATDMSGEGVTTINLREFTTNAAMPARPMKPPLAQLEQTQTVGYESDDKMGIASGSPPKGVVWITTERMQRRDSRDDSSYMK